MTTAEREQYETAIERSRVEAEKKVVVADKPKIGEGSGVRRAAPVRRGKKGKSVSPPVTAEGKGKKPLGDKMPPPPPLHTFMPRPIMPPASSIGNYLTLSSLMHP